MSSLPPVDAVILNYNGCDDTIACLESVLALDYPDLRAIVCDNGSTDGSLARLADWMHGTGVAFDRVGPRPEARPPDDGEPAMNASARVVLIDIGNNLGFTGGNNVGLRFAQATRGGRGRVGYVWLINSDVIVERDSLRRMVELAESDAGIGAVGATIFDFTDPDRVQEAGGGRLIGAPALVSPNHAGARRGVPLAAEAMDYVSGACMLVRATVLDEVGLLDERFFIYSEDIDWCARMRQRGFKLAYCEGAEIRHKASATTGLHSPFKDFHIVRSAFKFTAKHSPELRTRALVGGLYRFVLPKIMRGEWGRLGAVARGYAAYRRESARERNA